MSQIDALLLSAVYTQGLKWGQVARDPLISQVYNGSLIYSLVALNRIKYHQ